MCYVRVSKSVYNHLSHDVNGHLTEYFLGSLNMSKSKAGIWFVVKWDRAWGGHLKHFLQKVVPVSETVPSNSIKFHTPSFFLTEPWHEVDLISNLFTPDGAQLLLLLARWSQATSVTVWCVQGLISWQTWDPPLPGHAYNLPIWHHTFVWGCQPWLSGIHEAGKRDTSWS